MRYVRCCGFGWLGAVCAAAIGVAGLGAGCGPAPATQTQSEYPAPPVAKTQIVHLDDSTVTGVTLLHPDGRALAHYFLAEGGIVSCPNMDAMSLGKGGTPAAMARNWSKNDFQGQLSENLHEVNLPAAALGIEPDMTVREALTRMNRNPDADHVQALKLRGLSETNINKE